jgi:hypothetical protein
LRLCNQQPPCAALQSQNESSFNALFELDDNQVLIMLNGFDHVTFQELHNLFAPIFNLSTPSYQGAVGSYLKVNPNQEIQWLSMIC